MDYKGNMDEYFTSVLARPENSERAQVNQDYIGEHFMAVWEGSVSGGYSFHIMQIDPIVYLCKTENRVMAIEIVNRLDVTGSTPVGSED